MLTEREFKRYIRNFESGNDTVDYMCRNMTTLDDEQTRHWNDDDTGLDEHDLEALSPKVPSIVVRKIRQLGKQHFDPGRASRGMYDEWCLIASLLKPYISNRTLYKKDYSLWEGLLFAARGDKSYKRFSDWHYGSGQL